MFYSIDNTSNPPLLFSTKHQDQLFHAWLDAISEYPSEYINHRFHVFSSLMGAPNAYDLFPTASEPSVDRLVEVLPGNNWAIALSRKLINAASLNTPLYNGWWWMGVLLFLTITGVVLRGRHPSYLVVAALGASGLFYLLPYLFLAPINAFRYIYWSSMAGTMGSIILSGVLLSKAKGCCQTGWH